MAETETDQISAHVAVIAAAYLGNPSNPVERSQIVDVIREISAALTSPAAPEAPAEAEKPKLSPAAIRKSVTHEHLISFIDNKPYKSLKRHLATHGHTPKSYREHFGLKSDYPMVAPSYSEQRSELARKAGLGQRITAVAAKAPAQADAEAVAAPTAPAPEAPVPKPKAAKASAAKAAPAPKAAEAAPVKTKAPAKSPAPKSAGAKAPKASEAQIKASPKRAAAKA